jgi:hypothetical protein
VRKLSPTLKWDSILVYIEGISSMHFLRTSALRVLWSSCITALTIVSPRRYSWIISCEVAFYEISAPSTLNAEC